MNKWGLIFIFSYLISCSPRIIQFVNDQARFDQFNDYIIVGLKGQNMQKIVDDDKIIDRIEEAIHSELGRRGYAPNKQDPDLIVRYEVISSTKTQDTNQTMSPFQYTGYGPIYNFRTVIESILLVEILDASNQKLVWQASMDLRDHSKTTKRKDVLKAAVERLFDTYLYRAGQKMPDPNLKTNS
jgi:hypothetical protein